MAEEKERLLLDEQIAKNVWSGTYKGQSVAVKIVTKKDMREIEMLQRVMNLSCHGVVNIIDYEDHHDDGFYIIMEKLGGVTLFDFLNNCSGHVISDDILFDIIMQICDIVSCLHGNAILHNDIKPENIILFKKDDDTYDVRLIDFEYACVITDQKHCAPVLYAGTPDYSLYSDDVADYSFENILMKDAYALCATIIETIAYSRPKKFKHKMVKKMVKCYEKYEDNVKYIIPMIQNKIRKHMNK